MFKTFLGGSSIFNFCFLHIIRQYCFEPLIYTRNSLNPVDKICKDILDSLPWSPNTYQSGWEVEVQSQENIPETVMQDMMSIYLNLKYWCFSGLHPWLLLWDVCVPSKSICLSLSPQYFKVWPYMEIHSLKM